jgi:hypothetical protein
MMECLSLLLAASIHLGLEGNYQNIHPHVRCEVEHSFFQSTVAGVYYNSESTISTYVGQKFGALEVGIVTGYSSKSILPMLRFIKNGWFISPAYESSNWGVSIGYESKVF